MDVYTRRRAALRSLIDERYGGVQSRFAADIERQADYVSRCLKGTKRVGERFARHVEEALDLPTGWMDRDEGEVAANTADQVEGAQAQGAIVADASAYDDPETRELADQLLQRLASRRYTQRQIAAVLNLLDAMDDQGNGQSEGG